MSARREPRALGCLIALFTLGGAIGGGLLNQPVVGLLVGLGVSVLLALLFWLKDRRG